ncbi:MAG: MCE family protein [Candidatus Omnitrophota bacterium]|nr:MAG: MCE family protein [Candidatus Omnitrophota bacterium]
MLRLVRFGNIRNFINEIKIGAFTLFALLILFFALLSVRELTFFKGTYILRAKFDFAEGLRPASPVRFCGVDVGEVKEVEVIEEEDKPLVIVHAKIEQGIRIPMNSYFFVNSLSLFGEKYLEIAPPEKVTEYLGPNALVEGISPIPLFNLFATFNKTMKEVSEFVKEGKIKTTFENTLVNLEDISVEIKDLVKTLNSRAGTFGKLIYDDSLYKRTEEFIEDLQQHPWKLLYKPKKTKERNK